jgi:N-acetylneuraminate epimerase
VVQYYYPDSDCWQVAVDENIRNPRVTLPVTRWNNQWVFISGEIKPGIRTNSVLSINE